MTNLPANVDMPAWSSISPQATRVAAVRSPQSSAGRTAAGCDSARTTDAPAGSREKSKLPASDTLHNEGQRLPTKIPEWENVADLLKMWEKGGEAGEEGTWPFPPLRSWTESLVEEHRSTMNDGATRKRFNRDQYQSALDYLIISQMVTERERDSVSRVQAVHMLSKEKLNKVELRKTLNTREKDVIGRARKAAAQNALVPFS
jgi:hypothetical protein